MADITGIRHPQPIVPPNPSERVKEKGRSDNRRRKEEQPQRKEKRRKRPADDDGKPHIDEYA